MRLLILITLFAFEFPIQAQLSNNTFRYGSDLPTTKWGASFEALQYLKNNEYYNNINPGVTLFGFQARALLHYKINSNATFSTGALVQRDFGDANGLSKAIPVFNFQFKKQQWTWNLGNVKPHIHHNVIEPLLDYENIIRNPVEGGIQGIRKSEKMFYDFWLEWRQLAKVETGSQEKIVFGQSAEFTLLNTSSINLSIPMQAIVYHQGGQALNVSSHVATRMNAASGLRFRNNDTTLLLEGLYLYSLDNSETPSQPFNNGWAAMVNLRIKPWKSHEITFTWWHSREFISTTGSAVFSNVNLNDVYLNLNTRQLAMLRYVFSKPIVANKLWVDFRLEPYFDFNYKALEFSQGLYFRYVETINVKLPRWLGM